MSTRDAIVVVGAGLAGATAAGTLRELGYDGPLVLVGDEYEPPYDRPALSKAYLHGGADRSYIHPRHWYAANRIDLRLGVAVTHLDLAERRLRMADGRVIGYSKLLLATGSSPRRLSLPGAESSNVYYLRRLADADRIRAALRPGRHLLVVGGGWTGLEVAAAARTAGAEVTVLESAELPLLRALGPEVARAFADLHRDHGVALRCGVTVDEIATSGAAAVGVRLADGSRIHADAIVVGVGATPHTVLAEGAGLIVKDGIRVDADLATSHPDVYAAGDVANAWHPRLGAYIRIEHEDNARHQARAAAEAMLGRPVSYARLPCFFSDQYDVVLEHAGHLGPRGYDRVVLRGDLTGREFVAFWLRHHRVVAAASVNVPGVGTGLRALICAQRTVDADRLADPGVPLDELLPREDTPDAA